MNLINFYFFFFSFKLVFSWLWSPSTPSITSQPLSNSNSIKKEKYNCSLYLAPSFIKGVSRGVFAGKDFKKDDIIEISPTVAILTKFIEDLQIFNYAFSSNDDAYSISVFGVAMLFNHNNNKNVDYLWNGVPINSEKIVHNIFSQAHTKFTDVRYQASTNIRLGQELYSHYGDNWFENRNMINSDASTSQTTTSTSTSASPKLYTEEYLQENGICVSNVFINTSTIPLAGRGLFSKRNYKKGEIVTISPVLFLPKHRMQDESIYTSVLFNYCLTSEGSDVALLPIGFGSMINHGGKTKSNVYIDWYNWESQGNNDKNNHKNNNNNLPSIEWKAIQLERNPFAPLDIQYIATKDISIGDEILLSYGEKWEIEWKKYFNNLEKWHGTDPETNENNIIERPQFRQSIEVPKSFFPSHFYNNQCLGGKGCTKDSRKEENNNYHNHHNHISLEDIKKSFDYFNE